MRYVLTVMMKNLRWLVIILLVLCSTDMAAQTPDIPIPLAISPKTDGNIAIWRNSPVLNSIGDTGNATAPGNFTVDGTLIINNHLDYSTSVVGNKSVMPEDYGSPVLVVGTDRTYQNALIGVHDNKSPAGTFDFPTGVTGVGILHSPGGQVFGLFADGRIDVPTGTAVAAEFTATNESGQTAETDLPPYMGIPNGSPVSIGENLTCAVTRVGKSERKDCSIGLNIGNEDGNPASAVFAHGIFVSLFRQFGMVVAAQPSGSEVSIQSENNGNGINLVAKTKGAMQPDNTVIAVQDAGGGTQASIRQNGDVYANGLHMKLMTVAQLPICNPAIEGALYAVSDAADTGWNGPASAGGTLHTMVYCNSVEWQVK